ncbi:Chitin synthase 6 [Escovopsis weberi]|uniref:chitin synthase n=1 Tax=Escovopsis weberi TaxID=150374 RepID=A0A0M9VW32_ESCWE|nr:Chitin synthase 6 [Escovopsis weberi]
MANRMSMFSMGSEAPGNPRAGTSQQIDSSTGLVVNTWLTASQGSVVDTTLASRAWEHARRRAEDGCILLSHLHPSTPPLLSQFIAAFPFASPSTVYKALEAVQPFIRCVTPFNPSTSKQSGLSVALTTNLAGNLVSASLSLSSSGIDTSSGLLDIPKESGYRAFDVFYYLLTSASTPAEREFLGLKHATNYGLLTRSGTYEPPSYLPTADDAAAADDFRQALKDIGIKGSNHRDLISILAGLLKLGDTLDYNVESETLEEICEDVGGLLGMHPETLLNQCSTEDRRFLVAGAYEALVDWVISKANEAISAQLARIRDGEESFDGQGSKTPTIDDNGDTVTLTVLEIPSPVLGKAICMRSVFDDTFGINAEMIEDGYQPTPAGASITREVQQAISEAAFEMGVLSTPEARERQNEVEKREVVLEKVAFASDEGSFLRSLLFPVEGQGICLGRHGRFSLQTVLGSNRLWFHLCLHPTDDSPASLAALPSITSSWSAGTVSRQLRTWRLSEWANRRHRNMDFTADFDIDEFTQRYAVLGCKDGKDGIETWMLERGWSNGEVFIGKERVWIRESAWWEAEAMLDIRPDDSINGMDANPFNSGFETSYSANGSGFFPAPGMQGGLNDSHDQLVHQRTMSQGNGSQLTIGHAPQAAPSIAPSAGVRATRNGDYGLGTKGDSFKSEGELLAAAGLDDPENGKKPEIEEKEVDKARRMWVWFTWALTWWVPSPLLTYIGKMKRPDVRMAWREKLALCMVIAIINGIVVFWIVGFGKVLCPNMDKAWDRHQISTHQAANDYWVSHSGHVYDLTDWFQIQHSDTAIKTTKDNMLPLSGFDMDDYIMPPLYASCEGLNIPDTLVLQLNNSLLYQTAQHVSGAMSPDPRSALHDKYWYWNDFIPKMQEFYKGQLVYKKKDIKREGKDLGHQWAYYKNEVYDLTNYFHTQDVLQDDFRYQFLNSKVEDIFKENAGNDITKLMDELLNDTNMNKTEAASVTNSWYCVQRTFFKGFTDFRETPRCVVNNYILLAFTVILCTVIVVKFLAALQFSSSRTPSPQDKFVICQVPAYTEGEDSLRKALDSLTALQYDNKRKLICVICDGVLTGQGNDRPTPKIVLDILGVDPKLDPPALAFKAVGPSSDQLNFGKVYSGLYEYEGNVVPYLVVVKVGKESEQKKSKPGNRGKRDSQILLMSFLNRVHHRAPMSPMELEMFHQINNVIGVDPELYEYLLMVDADTCVEEDSLNRLVSACAHNAKIAGICGETSLENDEKSWWTMIQVYEYFISHHMAKAFESLFGSVTCLPGCFTMYRLRTADRGRPLIISDAVINDYSVCDVDTLHEKNLLSLGEDRYLTTLMTKHFPNMHFKFLPDAQCKTAAPESWSVLLSQRRRWINSTIHNLVELMRLKDMCGFCFFGMRFVVFIDLFGTLILPATCAYLVFLIYSVCTHKGAFPLWSIVILAAVYGLQALIFILKRQWQHIGWMIIYIIAFPIYSFVLPVYSFWNQDNFSWGNTRIVIGEKGNKQVVAVDDEGFDPRSIPLQLWDDYALANNLPGRRGVYQEKQQEYGGYNDQYEMDEMKSVYSVGPQGSLLQGMPGRSPYMAPQSPAPFAMGGNQQMGAQRQSMMSMGTGIQDMRSNSPYQDVPNQRSSMMHYRSQSNLSPPMAGGNRSSSSLGFGNGMRSNTSFDYQSGVTSDSAIVEAIQAVLGEVDLDNVTKKQVRTLVESRLQVELVGERRTFMDRQIDRELENM